MKPRAALTERLRREIAAAMHATARIGERRRHRAVLEVTERYGITRQYAYYLERKHPPTPKETPP